LKTSSSGVLPSSISSQHLARCFDAALEVGCRGVHDVQQQARLC